MREVNVRDIQKTVKDLCIKANVVLRPDILRALRSAFRLERNAKAKKILKALLENAAAAKRQKMAICQDTGMVAAYIETGEDTRIVGGSLENAINKGEAAAYRKGYFRKSVVKDPFIRINTKDNTPCVLYAKLIKGNRVKITISLRGFGSENKGKVKMFDPTASTGEIKNFIIGVVKDAGPDACPPYLIGVGIGGTLDKSAALAKEAILRSLNKRNKLLHIAKLEKELLSDINKLKIGPMGLGGKTTALGVNILAYPTHIAGMPVAVSIGCHATRNATKII